MGSLDSARKCRVHVVDAGHYSSCAQLVVKRVSVIASVMCEESPLGWTAGGEAGWAEVQRVRSPLYNGSGTNVARVWQRRTIQKSQLK